METTEISEASLLTMDIHTQSLCEVKTEVKLESPEQFEQKEYKYYTGKISKTEIEEETLHIWDAEKFEYTIEEEETDTDDILALDGPSTDVKEPISKTKIRAETLQLWEEEEIEYTFEEERAVDPLALDGTEAIEEQKQQCISKAANSSENSRVFSCKKCGVTFTSPRYLESHQKFCRGQKKSLVKVHPDKVTSDMQTLAKMIDGKKMYCCEFCDYKTNYSEKIKRHLVRHSGAKPFQCDICDKGFARTGSLSLHKRIHSQEKPYKCTVCSYASNYASHFKTHMIRHTGEKVYACKLCTYKTADNSNLSTHMRVHTKEKPYSCTHCDYKATKNITLKKHIQSQHTADSNTHQTKHKPFSCLLCVYKTSLKSELNRHMRKKHSDKSA